MDRIERYLDEVCRRIGGPRAMRAHVRQELREHLMDAVEGLRAGGMGEEEAVAKALEDFGGPEEMRGALEEAHGHRLTAVIVEKAMQWKEKTMKAKWLWMTVAHAAVIGVVVLEVMYVFAAMIFIVPKFREMVKYRWFATTGPGTGVNVWALHTLNGVAGFYENWWMIALLVAVAWGLFEWRVRGENKAWIRLSILGVAAVGMLVVSVMVSAALILPPMIEMPVMASRSQEIVRSAMKDLEREVPLAEAAIEKKDWDGVQQDGQAVRESLIELSSFWATGPLMMGTTDEGKIVSGRVELREAYNVMLRLESAAGAHDEATMREELKNFRAAMEKARGGGGGSATKP